jgi:hypothetical protein
MLSSPARIAVVVRCTVDAVYVTAAAGALASVQVRVEALGHRAGVWIVAIGYRHDQSPIVRTVPDAAVLAVEVEAGEAADSDDEAVEWAEAA